jgi:hypothetical protein
MLPVWIIKFCIGGKYPGYNYAAVYHVTNGRIPIIPGIVTLINQERRSGLTNPGLRMNWLIDSSSSLGRDNISRWGQRILIMPTLPVRPSTRTAAPAGAVGHLVNLQFGIDRLDR